MAGLFHGLDREGEDCHSPRCRITTFGLIRPTIIMPFRQVSPCWARYFLLRAQEKVPKEKGTRSPRRPCRYPAFLAVPGARITRQTFAGLPQTGCAPLSRN